jgi:plasmid rolling circle replication initiator protein Rep
MRNIAKSNYTLKETKEKRKPRIQFCGYAVNANINQPIKLCRNDKGGLFFNGVANCGGYWRCPVCALKISENKKELLSGLIDAHQSKGLSIGFLTLTVRHAKFDTLKKTLDKISKNYRSFQNQRFFSRNKIDFGLIGQVKTLEITHSDVNGWHPHLHILFFYNNSDVKTIEKFQKEFIKRWVSYKDNNGTISAQCQKMLFSDVSDYLAKYDITSEMTKGQIKSSKGLTPFTALAKIACGDYEDYHEKRKLYGIYSTYVEQTQGKHFVNISNSLRKEYSQFMEEFNKTDEEIVNEVVIDEVLLKISLPIWKKICKNDLQPLVLNKYKENGLEGVYNLLSYFRDFKELDIEIDNNQFPVLI